MTLLKSLALGGIMICLGTLAQAAEAISIEKAWARASIGNAPAGAAFLTVKSGGAADRLIGAKGDVAKKIELHTHIHDGGVMMMRQVEAIEVPAGGVAMLKPGGNHVMLIGLKAPLMEGESFPLTLMFEKAGEIKVVVEIRGKTSK